MEGETSYWGEAKDLIGTLLTGYTAIEAAKQAQRLENTRLQAELYGIPSRTSNPQAGAASYTDGIGGGFMGWVQQNPLMAGVAALGVAGLAWMAFK